MSAFSEIPGKELYIFPSSMLRFYSRGMILTSSTAPPADDATAVSNPAGRPPQAFSFEFSKVPRTPLAGGSVRIIDSSTFPISTTIAAAEVIVDPGAMRYASASFVASRSASADVNYLGNCTYVLEVAVGPMSLNCVQWHPSQDEWSFYL